ncbi:MAG: DinB family protein [Terracidiphilus sp.]
MTAAPTDIPERFLEQSRHILIEQCWPRLRGCVESLTEEQLWWRSNEACNSIGNLLLHLNGNVREWLVVSFNRLEDNRNRPAEFNQRESISASALLHQLGATIQQASEVLARLTPAELLAQYEIQGYKVSGLEAVYHVVEHFSMHYGQVLYIVKTLQGADLGFYSYLNKTGRAS